LGKKATDRVHMRDLLSIFKKEKSSEGLSRYSKQLQKRYKCFQKILSETSAILEIMADMEEKVEGDYLFDMQYVKSNLQVISHKVPLIIDCLNKISDGKYEELNDVLKRVESEIQAILSRKRKTENITKNLVNRGGGKDTNLLRVKSPAPLKGHKVLIDSGIIACRGVGTGNAYVVSKEEDLNNFPDGAILIAKNTSPKFVTVLKTAAAIVTDAGSASGYMASLAREFRVPTIVNTKEATKLIMSGLEITVDAFNGNIYEGRVNEVIELEQMRENLFKNTHIFEILDEVLKKIVPLNLIDLGDNLLRPELCKTLHDITFLAHEVSMDEMFKISGGSDVREGEAVKLDSKIPTDIYMIDLDGGIDNKLRSIFSENILSIPMNAFLKGMMSMKWPGPRPVNAKGFASAVADIALKTSHPRDKVWGKSFALVSREYMNFCIRLGYHLSTVEAYAGDNIDHNYIRFHFMGGGASLDRRLRRTRLIEEILEKLDFTVDKSGDVLNARINRYERSAVEKKLNTLGRLAVYTKQLDMVLFSDACVDYCMQDFMRDCCSR
jgi:pyruvate,water dikinase